MKEGSAWTSIVALALLLAGAGPCAAEAPATAPGAQPAALPASTVSPAIERFMRQNGGNLPAQPAARPETAQGRRPVPLPAPAPPAVNPRVAQRGRDLPPAMPVTAGANPLATHMRLKPAPLGPTDCRFPINLAAALRLSDARPLIVSAAQAGVWVAEAQLTQAKVLWVPTLLYGADYLRHDGGGPDFNKGIMTAPSTNYFIAGGAADLYVNLTDAIYEPLVARQELNSRHWDVQTAKNDALMSTADAYFQVHQYRGMYAGALYTVERGRDLVERITQLSKELVPRVEVDRARNMLADLEQRAVSARQEWRVQSANLTQVLRLDPRAVIVPVEHDHTQITLIDPCRSLDDLMAVALTNRPELASRRALVEAAEVRVRREKSRPLLPLVLVNGFQTPGMLLQAGVFGLGPNSSLNQFRGREDVSLQLMWQLEGMGIGNLARIKNQRGMESRAIINLRNSQDMVAADVTRAQARVQSAAARVVQADRSLRTGIITFNGHLEGLGQTRRFGDVLVLTFRPQEAVYSLELLNVAFNEYFTTVAEYNRAQFELFHALGYPASEVTTRLTPGAPLPVDTARPAFLPAVGHGPPPATRRAPARVDDPERHLERNSPMNSRLRGGRGMTRGVLALALGVWAVAGPAAVADDDGLPGNGLHGGPRINGTLGYGPPGLFPGFQGFGLGYHPGYGYGGDALGVGAEGGYPFYGGPGYPHPWPCLRRIGGIAPFPYFGGPGFPTPDHPNYFGGVGPLVTDVPVVTLGTAGPDPADSTAYGCFTGALPDPEARFSPATSRAAGLVPSGGAGPVSPSPNVPPAPVPGGSAGVPAAGRSLGIDAEPVVDSAGVRGMKVTQVYPGTAADAAGLRAGDVIRSVNGYLTGQPENLTWIIAHAAPDNVLKLNVRTANDDREQTLQAQFP